MSSRNPYIHSGYCIVTMGFGVCSIIRAIGSMVGKGISDFISDWDKVSAAVRSCSLKCICVIGNVTCFECSL